LQIITALSTSLTIYFVLFCVVYFYQTFLVLCLILLFSCSPGEKKSKFNKEALVEEMPQIDTNLLIESTKSKIDKFILDRSKDNDLSGAFLFAKGGKVYKNAFGKARKLKGADVGVNDVFQLASVSKFITAICILRLVDEGTLKLTDTIQNIIPDFKYRRVTVHHLLTHSSGLPEYTYLTDGAWRNDSTPKYNKDFVDVLHCERAHPYFNAGRRFNYCNSNFALLAYIAELKTNLTFPEVVKKYIKAPLALDSLHVFEVDKKGVKHYPVWGMRGDHSFIPDHQQNNINGDKGIYTNVGEMYLIYKALSENKLLSKESKKLLLTPHVRVKRRNAQYYCYGLRQIKLDNGKIWHYHNGWWHGFRSYFWFSLEQDKCIILLTNRLKGGFVNTKDMVHLLDD